MYKSETDTQELKVTFLDDFKITYKEYPPGTIFYLSSDSIGVVIIFYIYYR